jgi:acyl-CoA thioesterase I
MFTQIGRSRVVLAALAVAGAALLPGLALACPKSSMPTPLLPHAHAAVAQERELLIVTLGSSSTQGWRASDPAHTYPAVLQAELNASLPGAHVAVINRGIGGEDAPEELARLVPDVIAIRPQLVVWQVGANGAMRGNDPSVFEKQVTEGVEAMHEAGIDVILMDNQRSPHVMAAPQHGQMEAALAEVAEKTGASLFARSKLMDEWKDEGAPYAQFIADDGVHQNDMGYACVAQALAATVTDSLKKPVIMADLGGRASYFMPHLVAKPANAPASGGAR